MFFFSAVKPKYIPGGVFIRFAQSPYKSTSATSIRKEVAKRSGDDESGGVGRSADFTVDLQRELCRLPDARQSGNDSGDVRRG